MVSHALHLRQLKVPNANAGRKEMGKEAARFGEMTISSPASMVPRASRSLQRICPCRLQAAHHSSLMQQVMPDASPQWALRQATLQHRVRMRLSHWTTILLIIGQNRSNRVSIRGRRFIIRGGLGGAKPFVTRLPHSWNQIGMNLAAQNSSVLALQSTAYSPRRSFVPTHLSADRIHAPNWSVLLQQLKNRL